MRSVLMLFLVSAAMCGLVLTSGCTSESVDAGPTEQCVFEVNGMTCEGCASTVRKAVAEVPGVQSVDVSWQNNQVVVKADPKMADADTILAAIAKTGYEVQVAGEKTAEPPAEPQSEGEPASEPPAG